MTPGRDISVVLVSHNRAAQLPLVLRGLAANTLRPAEVLLADDASTDESVAVFERLCAELGLPGRALRHERGPNRFRINSMRNAGLAAARADRVVILDADHVPGPLHLASHARMLDAGERVISTGPRLEAAHADGSGPVNFMWGHEPYGAQQDRPDAPLPFWGLVAASNMGLHRAFARRVGGFDPGYDGHYGYDDTDFTCRAAATGAFFAGRFEAYVVHLPHETIFGHRDGAHNAELFRQKHGRELTYPAFVPVVTYPENWARRYARFRQAAPAEQRRDAAAPSTGALWHGPAPAAGQEAIEATRWASTNVGGRLLLRLALGKLLVRLCRRGGRA